MRGQIDNKTNKHNIIIVFDEFTLHVSFIINKLRVNYYTKLTKTFNLYFNINCHLLLFPVLLLLLLLFHFLILLNSSAGRSYWLLISNTVLKILANLIYICRAENLYYYRYFLLAIVITFSSMPRPDANC